MRRFLLGLVASVAAAAGFAPEARAQVPFTNINDPFFAYYSFYLPRQQAQALQPGPEATIAAITANRQAYASTNRNEMFSTTSPGLESDEFNPNSGAPRQGGTSRVSQIGGNLNGFGPSRYYNNVGRYHPTVRPGVSRNKNVSVIRNQGFSGGGAGGGIGLPGPR